jgi:hypothetical protein
VRARKPTRSPGIVPGSQVTLNADQAFSASRFHLRAHAMRGDLGTVIEPQANRTGWTLVKFDDCSMVHRLSADEISLSKESKK